MRAPVVSVVAVVFMLGACASTETAPEPASPDAEAVEEQKTVHFTPPYADLEAAPLSEAARDFWHATKGALGHVLPPRGADEEVYDWYEGRASPWFDKVIERFDAVEARMVPLKETQDTLEQLAIYAGIARMREEMGRAVLAMIPHTVRDMSGEQRAASEAQLWEIATPSLKKSREEYLVCHTLARQLALEATARACGVAAINLGSLLPPD